MITDFEYLPLFLLSDVRKKLQLAGFIDIQLVNMHKKVDQTCATSRNRHSYIDKIEWLYNNVITLIKHLIKVKIKE